MKFPSQGWRQSLRTAVVTADTRSDEPAFIVYTSGTTGKPKGIVHAHRWIVALGDLNRYRLPPQENDVVMATGEWSFISALGHNLLFPLRNGVTGAIFSGRATPENVLAAVERFKVNVLHCVATIYRRLLAMPEFEKQHDLTSLRCSHSTGEALREATYDEWKRRVGSELYEHYGVSEYQLVIGNGVRDPVKPGSVGKLLPGVGAAILDDDLKPVASGELGQFAISTSDPGLFLGYYKDPERTEAVIRNGWYLHRRSRLSGRRRLFLHRRPARRLFQEPRHFHIPDRNRKRPAETPRDHRSRGRAGTR